MRTEVAYSKHTCFDEKLNGDLNNKVMKNIMYSELADRPCNCNVKSLLPNGKCMYGRKCMTSMVVYELKWKVTGKSYIGKTQDYLIKRTQQHVDVWKVIESGRAKYGHEITLYYTYTMAKHQYLRNRMIVNSRLMAKHCQSAGSISKI